jgi:anti-anti-sigma factor
MALSLNTQRERGVLVVTAEGRLNASPELQDFRETLIAAIEAGDSRLVLDFSAVGYVDSIGIEAIISVYQKALEANGGVRVLSPGPKLKQLLNLTKLSAVLGVVDDKNEAIDSLLAL